MNQVTCYDLHNIQKQIASSLLNQSNRLLLPSSVHFQQQKGFQNAIFKSAPLTIRKLISCKLRLGQRLVSVNPDQDNSGIKAFIYTLLMIIYRPPSSNTNQTSSPNFHLDILLRLKEHLYAIGTKLQMNQHQKHKIQQGHSMRIILAQFLKSLEIFKKQKHTDSVAQYIQRYLNTNPKLFQVLAFLFQPIYGKSNRQTKHKNLVESQPELIIQLLQHFGLRLRYQNDYILLYQVGYFITFMSDNIVCGEYYSENLNTQMISFNSFGNKTAVKLSQSQKIKSTEQSTQLIANSFLFRDQQNCYQDQSLQKLDPQHQHPKIFPRNSMNNQDCDQLYQRLREQFAKVVLDYTQAQNQSLQTFETSAKSSFSNNTINCCCCQRRLPKNSFSSKVLEFTYEPYIPSKVHKTYEFFTKNDRSKPKIKINALNQLKNEQLQFSRPREDKVPAFIKCKTLLKGSQLVRYQKPEPLQGPAQEQINQQIYKPILKNFSQNIFRQKDTRKYDQVYPQKLTFNQKKYHQIRQQVQKMFHLNHIRSQSLLGGDKRTWKNKSNCCNFPNEREKLMSSSNLISDNLDSKFRSFVSAQIKVPAATPNSKQQNKRAFHNHKQTFNPIKSQKSESFKRQKTVIGFANQKNFTTHQMVMNA